MPTAAPVLPPIPTQEIPVIDPETGKINADWYKWLKLVEIVLRKVRSEIP